MSDTKTAPVAVVTPTPVETNPLPQTTPQTDLAIAAQQPSTLPPYTDNPDVKSLPTEVNEKAHPIAIDPNAPPQDPEKGQFTGIDPRCVPIESAHLDPVFVKCHFCGHEGMTRVELENGSRSITFAAIGCFLVGLLGLIPLCISTCKDRKHFCAQCGGLLKHWEYH